MRSLFRVWLFTMFAAVVPGLAWGCGVSAQRAVVHRASLVPVEVAPTTITFLGHATFLIESPGGTGAVTDYSGRHVPPRIPDLVTMNHAHTTHYTDHPDPRIRHVLRGWSVDGGPARHDLKVGDMRVRNLPTNIRNWEGGTRRYGNSIFIFETGGLCIAHLGHLHHLLTADDLAVLGQLDVVMVPIDGAWTSTQGDMVEVLEQLNPRLILPMHYWSQSVLDGFLNRMRARAEIRIADGPSVRLSRADLPATPMVLVLPGPHF